MKVVNVAGFHIKFDKDGATYNIPFDNKLHFIPDKCFYEDNFDGLLRVIVPPVSIKQVVKEMNTPFKIVDINDPTIKEIIIERVEEKISKPLMGKKLKSKVRSKLKKTRFIEPKEEVKNG